MQAQPDKNFKCILVYQDHLTKFVLLRPITHKRKREMLLAFYWTFLLHLMHLRYFIAITVENLLIQILATYVIGMWPELKIVHGKPRHSQNQGSIERANHDIENMIANRFLRSQDNNTRRWSEELKFIQFMKNVYSMGLNVHHTRQCLVQKIKLD
jgi:hypothetical protein